MLNRIIRTIPGLLNQFLIVNETFPKAVRSIDFNLKCCIFENPSSLLKIDDHDIHLTGLYYQSFKYFPEMQNELKSYLQTSESDLSQLPVSNKNNYVNCIHIRRGDFLEVGFHVADSDFIKKGIEFITRTDQQLKRNMSYVMFGDDLQFMEHFLKSTGHNQTQTYFISQNSETEDLVYSMKNCDTVFISAAHSTFGWWMGYFSKGKRVYYADIRVTNDSVYKAGELNPDDYYLPHWIPLRLDDQMNVVRSFIEST